jgi:DNA mismatch endonuclease (patch repair protein)
MLQKALRQQGLRFRMNDNRLPGCPDIVFADQRLCVFCDGDFWHGRNLKDRLRRLRGGHNAEYWVAKIQRNVKRDRTIDRELQSLGWQTLRLWESDIRRSAAEMAAQVDAALRAERSVARRRAKAP